LTTLSELAGFVRSLERQKTIEAKVNELARDHFANQNWRDEKIKVIAKIQQ
jgi:hypothetical protein